jgi:hypothetical protein
MSDVDKEENLFRRTCPELVRSAAGRGQTPKHAGARRRRTRELTNSDTADEARLRIS